MQSNRNFEILTHLCFGSAFFNNIKIKAYSSSSFFIGDIYEVYNAALLGIKYSGFYSIHKQD